MPPLAPFRDQADPIWEQLVNELKSGGQIEASAITTEKLAAEAVTTAKLAVLSVTSGRIAANAVEQSKIKQPTVPVTGASEGLFGLGAGGGTRTLIANLQAKAEATYSLNHKQNTEMPLLWAYNKTKKASSTITWEVVNAEEVKFTLGTSPAAKDEVLIGVIS